MDLVLNEEQRILKHAAGEFFTAQMPLNALRDLRDNADATGFDRAAWREMAEMGWAGILVPEAYGGVEFGYKGIGQVLEQAGRTLAASPLVSTALTAAPLVLAAGSEAQKADILPAVAGGEMILALALDEGPRHAPTCITTRAEAAGDGYRISGRKVFVLDGHVADQVIVVARSGGGDDETQGISLFLVPAEAAGLTRSRTAMVDSRNAALLSFDGVEVGADALLGELGQGYGVLEAVLDGARAGLAAEMLGCGLEAFERTVDYLKVREQFDAKIGSFQALKHRAALMFCELELCKSAVVAALSAIDANHAERAALASLAKAKACDMLELVTRESVQMHGGIGMTDEADIGLFLKRAGVAEQTFGDGAFHRARYAELMGY